MNLLQTVCNNTQMKRREFSDEYASPISKIKRTTAVKTKREIRWITEETGLVPNYCTGSPNAVLANRKKKVDVFTLF